MLVISRRAQERLSFPELGITIHFIRVRSGAARIGIDAPRNIQIVRDESHPDDAARAAEVRKELICLPQKVRHAIRNELHSISVGLHLYSEQMKLGITDGAESTMELIRESIKRLDENRVLQRPDSAADLKDKGRAPTLLLVEDEANERELLEGLLRIKGYSVVSVGDGFEALDYLAFHETPSTILLDMLLPNCDGASTCRKIRADELHRNALIYAISGTSPEENGLEIGTQGVNRWFQKPLNVQVLMESLPTP